MAAAATSNRSGRQPVLDVSPVAVLAGGHAGTIRALLLVPGAGYLVSAASDRVVKVWDYTAPAEEEPAPTTTTTTTNGGGGGGGCTDGDDDDQDAALLREVREDLGLAASAVTRVAWLPGPLF